MGNAMLTDKLIQGLKKGDLKVFKQIGDFIDQFKLEEIFSHLENTAIPSCAKFHCRFYAQEHANINLQEAYDALRKSKPKLIGYYLQKAGNYLQKLSNQPAKNNTC